MSAKNSDAEQQMSAENADAEQQYKTLSLHAEVYDRLKATKPFSSMSYNELIEDMVDVYCDENERGRDFTEEIDDSR